VAVSFYHGVCEGAGAPSDGGACQYGTLAFCFSSAGVADDVDVKEVGEKIPRMAIPT